MKDRVTKFKDLLTALKELAPFVKSGTHLESGKPFKQLEGMRSREAWANWLICAAVNGTVGDGRLEFATDPSGADGRIIDTSTGGTWQMEHVMVRARRDKPRIDIEAAINGAVTSKVCKGGAAYAAGKTLVVLLYAPSEAWFPNRVARNLPHLLHFDAVWVVALQNVVDGAYTYAVTRLERGGTCLDRHDRQGL